MFLKTSFVFCFFFFLQHCEQRMLELNVATSDTLLTLPNVLRDIATLIGDTRNEYLPPARASMRTSTSLSSSNSVASHWKNRLQQMQKLVKAVEVMLSRCVLCALRCDNASLDGDALMESAQCAAHYWFVPVNILCFCYFFFNRLIL